MDVCLNLIPSGIESLFYNLYTLVLFLMVVIVAFLHIFSRIFKEIAGIAQTELREIYISIFIGIFSLLFAVLSCQVISAYIQSKYNLQGDHFFIADVYMSSLILGEKGGVVLSTELYKIAFGTSFMSKGFKLEGSFKIFAFLEYFATGLKFLLGLFYSFTVVSLQVQRISLYAAKEFAYSLILPVGLILRVIPITRGAGSFLIALAFGLYIVWPILFVFEYDVTTQIMVLKKEEIDREIAEYFKMDPNKLMPQSPGRTIEILKRSLGPQMVTDIFKVYSIVKDLAMVIIPQSTILGVINFTLLIVFVNSLGDFIKGL